MGQNDNGLTQSPFSDAVVPVPSATSGDQGTGGGLDPGPGGDGHTTVPWTGAPVPTPSNMDESGPFGNPSRPSSVEGSTHKGETLQGDITTPPLHTIDKR